MSRSRSSRGIRFTGAAAAAVLLGAGAIVGVVSPAAAADGDCDPATTPPTLNTWYDGNGKYQGTRLAHRETSYHLYDDIYDTYGHNYRQVEMWERGGFLPPRRVSCERKPHTPQDQPEEPTITGTGGGYISVGFPTFGSSFIMVGSAPRKGRVDVGDIEPL